VFNTRVVNSKAKREHMDSLHRLFSVTFEADSVKIRHKRQTCISFLSLFVEIPPEKPLDREYIDKIILYV